MKSSESGKDVPNMINTEEVKDAVQTVADNAAAAKIEVKKTVRSAAKTTKEKAAAVKDKAAAKAAVKKEDAKEVKAAVKAEAKDAKTVKKIEAGKAKAAASRKAAAVKQKVKAAAKKPTETVKTNKVNFVFQSAWGGAVTLEELAAKLPKEAANAYVKIEENKIYWVSKKGDLGNVDIW